jgi:hypothetical protein
VRLEAVALRRLLGRDCARVGQAGLSWFETLLSFGARAGAKEPPSVALELNGGQRLGVFTL